MRPHLFRTHDGGKTWKEINNGIPDGAATSTIREDPKQKGLLYAGTETQVYVSFDDGDHWQSLRLNMPASSVRDLAIKDDDLIAGTHGRGYLILDNVTPLRQLAANAAATKPRLYAPQTAMRIRNNMNPPTPWPPDMATGENPPSGAMIDYFVDPKFSGAITLEIVDGKGTLVSRFKSTDPVPPLDPRYPDPTLWARAPRTVSTAPGHHRFLWDMRYEEIPGMSTGPDASDAVPHNTPSVPSSPYVLPGTYTVRMIAGAQTLTAPITVVLDPRVKTPSADITQQYEISRKLYDSMLRATVAIHEIAVVRDQLRSKAGGATTVIAAGSLEAKLNAIAGGGGGRGGGGGGRGGPAGPPNLNSLRTALARLEHSIQNADAAPTAAQIEAADLTAQPLPGLLQQWDALKKSDLKALNQQLLKQHLPLLSLDTHFIDHGVEDQIEIGDID